MDDHLDSLLAPDRLSGPEHDRILGKVVSGQKPARARWWLLAASLATAAVLVAIVEPEQFRSKGGQHAGLVVEVTCSAGCTTQSRVIAAISGAATQGLVKAYLVSPSGRRVDWLATEDGVELALHGERLVLPRVILIDDVFTREPGTWRLIVDINEVSGETALDVHL